MLLFYIRHGDPIYNPNSLTPLGERQAEALAKRLALHGIDKVFSSPSNRALLTARPTCDILGLKPRLLEFADENYGWKNLTGTTPEGKTEWLFGYTSARLLLNDPSVRELGFRWFEHPEFKGHEYGKEMERVYDGTDEFLASLGYEHER